MSATIQTLFKKDITRDIQGVIKVGQQAEDSVFQELDEYVVTQELKQHFRDFFQAYNRGIDQRTDKMGVWISGFFGSGKSHFLKILSYLLNSGKSVHGRQPVDFFMDKVQDPELLEWMHRASEIPTDIILFNVDSKSDAEGKHSREAIVKVFNKVFNELRDFSAANPWLADLEETLEKKGEYAAFKDAFTRLYGASWEESRDDIYYIEDTVVQALAESTAMTAESARNWIRKGPDTYTLSIESFAQRVNDYVEYREEDYHLVFLADEMGQYISDNTRLMLNLQTVVEDLGKLTHGKVWVIVTSQQDIDSIKRNLSSNDFSKIQGRFDTRLSLSSANVDEVIKKRILEKTEGAAEGLRQQYYQVEAVLKNILTFSEKTAEMRTFESAADFAEVYPFVPYQFHLLQKVFTGIREHGASGKHLAEGERSLLSAFKEAALQYKTADLQTLIPFSAFYATIDSFLENTVRSAVIQAEQNNTLESQDVEVLKLLFLIRYVKEMPSTLDNIVTLMIDSVQANRIEMKKSIQASLNRLLSQYLIQKNGEEYLFLTNEEQDVNREIKHTHVPAAEVLLKIGERIYTDIFPDKKYRYSPQYDFPFNTWIDERSHGNVNADIGLKVVTPYYDGPEELTLEAIRFMSTRDPLVIVLLPEDTSYLEEMEDVLKIQRYLRSRSGEQQDDRFDEIRARKNREANEKMERIRLLLEKALSEATIVLNGSEQEIKAKKPGERMQAALRMLIDNQYSKLNYMEHLHTVEELREIQHETQLTIEGSGEDPNPQATEEILRYVERLENRQPLSLRHVLTRFAQAPYGWKEDDILASILRLLRDQEIKLMLDHVFLNIEESTLVKQVTTRTVQERILVQRRKRIAKRLVHITQEIIEDIFAIRSLPADEDGLMKEVGRLCARETEEIQAMLSHYRTGYYPQKEVLEHGLKLFEGVAKKGDAQAFFAYMEEHEDDFLDYADDIGQIKSFFKHQYHIFDKARKAIRIYDSSKAYITDQRVESVVETMRDITRQEKPYTRIQEIPQLEEQFRNRIIDLLERESEPIRQKIESDRDAVRAVLAESTEAKAALAEHWNDIFRDLQDRLEQSQQFAEIISLGEESERQKVRALQEIDTYNNRLLEQQQDAQEAAAEQSTGTSPAGSVLVTPSTETHPEPDPHPRQRRTLTLSKRELFKAGMIHIENQEDIDTFVDEIRQQLEQALEEGTIIRLT